MGFYGYYSWSNNKSKSNQTLAISEKGLGFHLIAIVSSALTAICLGWYFENYSDATSILGCTNYYIQFLCYLP